MTQEKLEEVNGQGCQDNKRYNKRRYYDQIRQGRKR